MDVEVLWMTPQERYKNYHTNEERYKISVFCIPLLRVPCLQFQEAEILSQDSVTAEISKLLFTMLVKVSKPFVEIINLYNLHTDKKTISISLN